jgi:hypothetical protein
MFASARADSLEPEMSVTIARHALAAASALAGYCVLAGCGGAPAALPAAPEGWTRDFFTVLAASVVPIRARRAKPP